MTLSTAIRLGAMIRPQGFTRLLRGGKSCALGAAMEAAGMPIRGEGHHRDLRARWPILAALDPKFGTVLDAIMFRNDIDKWTREEIADWIETLEAREEAAGLSLQAGDGSVSLGTESGDRHDINASSFSSSSSSS